MKTIINSTYRTFITVLAVFAILFATWVQAAAKPVKVAVVPFKINSRQDLSFLRDGIVDMLSSRLSWEGKVSVLSRQTTENAFKDITGPLNEKIARKTGKQLGVDYVLFGSITVFGNSVSIDTKMIDVTGEKSPLTFFNQSKGMDQVIPGINLFAGNINEKIFGRKMPAGYIPSPVQVSQPQTGLPPTDIRANPEKLITGGFGDQEQQNSTLGPAFITVQNARNRSNQFWKSRNIKRRLVGIAIGDVNKDGQKETILVSDHTVDLYRMINNRFVKVKTIADHRLDHFISVDVADINGNGYPEIFVTSLKPYRKFVNSFVLEFDGRTYREIVKSSQWFFRVINVPDRGEILLGQKSITDSPFSGAIFEMAWQNGSYEPGNQVMRSYRANVLGFTFGNAINEDNQVMVAFDDQDYLKIYNPAGKSKWKDGEHSGGTPEYFELPNTGTGDTKNFAYFPMRIIIKDIDHDGKNEVVTIDNKRLSELISFRKFTNGKIQIRAWDGVGLATLWRTRKLSGYFSDFAIGDFDNDGKDEIVAVLVIKTGSVVTTKPKSALIAYQLK